MKKHMRAALRPQSVRFVVVGAANTIIDFVVLNLLATVMGFPRIPSNIVSMTVAMTFSFIANKRLVFKSNSDKSRRQAALFVGGTLIGLYVIQTTAIYLFTEVWTSPVELVIEIEHALGLGDVFTDDFVYTNTAKVFATVFSLIWNYNFYKRVVFKDE